MERMKMMRENENESGNPRTTFSTIGSTVVQKKLPTSNLYPEPKNHRNSSHVVSVLTWNNVQYLLCVGDGYCLQAFTFTDSIRSFTVGEVFTFTDSHRTRHTHTLTHLHPWSSDVTGLKGSLFGVCLMRQTSGF